MNVNKLKNKYINMLIKILFEMFRKGEIRERHWITMKGPSNIENAVSDRKRGGNDGQ